MIDRLCVSWSVRRKWYSGTKKGLSPLPQNKVLITCTSTGRLCHKNKILSSVCSSLLARLRL